MRTKIIIPWEQQRHKLHIPTKIKNVINKIKENGGNVSRKQIESMIKLHRANKRISFWISCTGEVNVEYSWKVKYNE